jgi:hypothetical protein
LTQVAKNHFAFATALLWHLLFEITLKLYLPIWKIFKPNYEFLVSLCFYLVQKYEKNAANDKWFFTT